MGGGRGGGQDMLPTDVIMEGKEYVKKAKKYVKKRLPGQKDDEGA